MARSNAPSARRSVGHPGGCGRFHWPMRRASIQNVPELRLLLVEDEARLAAGLRRGLDEQGFAVQWVASAESAEAALASGAFDLMVLDLRLPGKDGLALLREMRGAGNSTPVLILTARGALEERVGGLDGGADDYLTKPFAFAELVARLRALARRPSPTVLRVADLELDLQKRRARRAARPLSLSPKETMLLELFMRHAGEVVTRDMIGEALWDSRYNVFANLIEVFVNRIRQKIDRAGEPSLLVTVRGVGYSMRID